MSEQTKAAVRRFLEFFDKGDLARVSDVATADFVDHNPMPGQSAGIEGLKQMLAMARAAFPDLHTTIEDMVAEGDKVAVMNTLHGTHKGEFMGIAPTNKKVAVTGIDILRIAGGKVAERWGYMDESGMMRQLGIAPPG
ncbi:MAG: ester cyclase [Chloroflexi bacterium]|nr:ester cyclase [Chloroflexota bacterium]